MKLKIEKLGFEFDTGDEFAMVITTFIISAIWLGVLVTALKSTMKEACRYGYAEEVNGKYEWIIPGKAKKEVDNAD